MRILTWNCSMAFRKKWQYADGFAPDLMVICEAEEPSRQPAALIAEYPHHDWIGDNPNKGLLVLAKEPWALVRASEYDPAHRLALPLNVTGPLCFGLLAVWAQRTPTGTYCQHTNAAIRSYAGLVGAGGVVAGDFNANTIWDPLHRSKVTHCQNVQLLDSLGLHSAYHRLSGEPQGGETQFTHAYRRWPTHLFHIDYCFYSANSFRLTAVDVPPVAEWAAWSDHGPLVADFAAHEAGGPAHLNGSPQSSVDSRGGNPANR